MEKAMYKRMQVTSGRLSPLFFQGPSHHCAHGLDLPVAPRVFHVGRPGGLDVGEGGEDFGQGVAQAVHRVGHEGLLLLRQLGQRQLRRRQRLAVRVCLKCLEPRGDVHQRPKPEELQEVLESRWGALRDRGGTFTCRMAADNVRTTARAAAQLKPALKAPAPS